MAEQTNKQTNKTKVVGLTSGGGGYSPAVLLSYCPTVPGLSRPRSPEPAGEEMLIGGLNKHTITRGRKLTLTPTKPSDADANRLSEDPRGGSELGGGLYDCTLPYSPAVLLSNCPAGLSRAEVAGTRGGRNADVR
eukprot:1181609-Prorocentrum_minimum.AAC.5